MKTKILSLLLIISLMACQSSIVEPSPEIQLTILSPKGAPALALFPILFEQTDTVDFVDGVDVLSAEFIKGEYDVIVAPVNLGAQLSSKQDNPYVLFGILTWGNLYVLSNPSQADATKMAIFGQQAVPGKVLSVVEPLFKSRYTFDAFNSVAEVSAQLLAEQYALGLLAEPSLSASIMRAKAAGLTLEIIYDIQALWQQKTGYFNYPQAGLFIRKDLSTAEGSAVLERMELMQAYIESLHTDIQRLDQDVLNVELEAVGLPSSAVLKEAFARMNVKPLLAQDEFDVIEAFLQQFNLNKLQGFYYHLSIGN